MSKFFFFGTPRSLSVFFFDSLVFWFGDVDLGGLFESERTLYRGDWRLFIRESTHIRNFVSHTNTLNHKALETWKLEI